jgi:hypothetical protein
MSTGQTYNLQKIKFQHKKIISTPNRPGGGSGKRLAHIVHQFFQFPHIL